MHNPKFQPCLIIPCFNHADSLQIMLGQLVKFEFNIIIVDDGSEPMHAEKIRQLPELFSNITLIRHKTNQGKGVAVISALRKAYELHFTHALQIDADGQHKVEEY